MGKLADYIRSYLRSRCLFHFTDTRNLKSIRLHGLLSKAELERRGIVVEAPGGNTLSRDLDVRYGLSDYVNLCFCESHPMHFVAKNESRILKSRFIRVHSNVLLFEGVKIVLGVANSSRALLLDPEDAIDAMDTEALFGRLDWRVPEQQARRRNVEKYEVLVPNSVPLEYLSAMG